jgi:type I restriction enzyme S subunit
MGSGTIFKSVTKEDMYSIKFLMPSKAIIETFEKIATPIFLQIANLAIKNTNLQRTRDLLLPRLISGEVDVSAFEAK